MVTISRGHYFSLSGVGHGTWLGNAGAKFGSFHHAILVPRFQAEWMMGILVYHPDCGTTHTFWCLSSIWFARPVSKPMASLIHFSWAMACCQVFCPKLCRLPKSILRQFGFAFTLQCWQLLLAEAARLLFCIQVDI